MKRIIMIISFCLLIGCSIGFEYYEDIENEKSKLNMNQKFHDIALEMLQDIIEKLRR